MTAYDLALADVVKSELARRHRSSSDLARAVGLSPDRLRARLQGRTGFTLPELFAIAEAFSIEPQRLIAQVKDHLQAADD